MSNDDPRVATKESWNVIDVHDEDFVVIPYDKSFDATQFAQIARGYIPCDMDHKWFIYLENLTLHIHRSWTGAPVFRVAFHGDRNGFRVAKTEVYKESVHSDDGSFGYEIELLDGLIRGWLLEEQVTLPMPPLTLRNVRGLTTPQYEAWEPFRRRGFEAFRRWLVARVGIPVGVALALTFILIWLWLFRDIVALLYAVTFVLVALVLPPAWLFLRARSNWNYLDLAFRKKESLLRGEEPQNENPKT